MATDFETRNNLVREPDGRWRLRSGCHSVPETMLDWAFDAVSLGYRVVPLVPGGTERLDVPDGMGFRDVWATHPDANVGADLGAGYRGVTVLRVDPDQGGSLATFEVERGLYIPYERVVSVPGGITYVHMQGRTASYPECLGPGLDVMSSGEYVPLPGSRVGGGEYAWRRLGPGYPTLPEAPAWLLDAAGPAPEPGEQLDRPYDIERAVEYLRLSNLHARPGEARICDSCPPWEECEECRPAVPSPADPGRLFKVAWRLAKMGIDRTAAAELMAEHYAPRCEPVPSAGEVRKAVDWAYDKVGERPIQSLHSTR